MKTVQGFKILALIVSAAVFVLFTWLWWQRTNMPYDETGRHYDGLTVWHEQSVLIYALLSIFSFSMLVATSYLVWRK